MSEIDSSKVCVILPAFNASSTLERCYRSIPEKLRSNVILVDDASSDDTFALAQRLGIANVFQLPVNSGYGANQKRCYREALLLGAEVIVMLHPDDQYSASEIPALIDPILNGIADVVLGSRIAGGAAINNGMPKYKYVFNRLLTRFQNVCSGLRLSEYHTGFRAYSATHIAQLPYESYSNGFVFDNEILVDTIRMRSRIKEVATDCVYGPESSSIGPKESVKYGIGVLRLSMHLWLFRLFNLKYTST